MKFLTNEEAQMRDEYEKEIRNLKCEIARLRGQIETLVTVLEFEGVKYNLDDEGNQHFDYSRVKESRVEQIAEEVAKRLSENWKDVPANPSGFGMKLTDEEIEGAVEVVGE